MLVKFVRFFVPVTLCFSIYACVTYVRPIEPNPLPPAPGPALDVSSISIPISAEMSQIAAYVDSMLGTGNGAVYFGSGINIDHGATLQIGVHRAGPTTVTGGGNQITLAVPLAIDSGRIDWHFGPVHHHMDFGGALTVFASVGLSVLPDWTIQSNTNLSFRWDQGAWIDLTPPIGHIRIGVESLATPAVNHALGQLSGRVQSIVSNIQLRDKLQIYWGALQEPVKVSSAYSAYLLLTPSAASLSGLTVQGSRIVITPAIQGTIEGLVTTNPPKPTPTALPQNSPTLGPVGVQIDLRTAADFSEMTDLVKKAIVGKAFKLVTKVTIRPTNVKFSSNGNKVVVWLEFSADLPDPFHSASGWIYLEGTPEFYGETGHLKVTHLEFDENTDNTLVSVADWLLHGYFLEQLEKYLDFDLSSKIDPLKTSLLGKSIQKSLGLGAVLTISPKQIVIGNIYVAKDRISIDTKLTADAAISVDPISLK